MKKLTVLVALMAAGVAALVAVQIAGATSSQPTANAPTTSECQLGNGVQHVINIVFDNVHFFRDNPNVPSDLEQMPHLLNFLESNGRCSRTHTRR